MVYKNLFASDFIDFHSKFVFIWFVCYESGELELAVNNQLGKTKSNYLDRLFFVYIELSP